MAELAMVDGWGRFSPLHRGRCLENLIIRYVYHSSKSVKSEGQGADQIVEGSPKSPAS